MTYEKLHPTYSFTKDRLVELQSVIPEAFEDGSLSWDTLRESLGDWLADEDQTSEHYGLTWPGKREARCLAANPSHGTLRPAMGEGISENTTSNVFIEGDNLEVLKLLQKSYAGQVKMIYIDPPYNRGEDLIYKDNYVEPLEDYLRRSGQTSEGGELLTSNPKSSGRFHTNWLNMMYPRLRLARTLLRDDGVIFASIDDNEVHNLRSLMDEIFGQENFAGMLVWQSKKGGGSDNNGMVKDQEYVYVYGKQVSKGALTRLTIEAEELDKSDRLGPYRLGRELNKWGANSRREDRPTMYFPITGPNGEDVFPIRNDGTEGCWRWGTKKMLAAVENGNLEYVPREDGTFVVYEKIRSTDPRSKPFRTWLTDVGTTADGSTTVKDLFGGKKVADFPKPLPLLLHLLRMGTSGNGDIVLDFFAGTGTTAQAVMKLNREDEGERQFICVQVPESTPITSEARKAGYLTLADLCKERIRRAIALLQSEKGMEMRDYPEDLGYKVLKLSSSHFKAWQDYQGSSMADIQNLFNEFEDPLVEGWKKDSLLTEILLIEGFPLNSSIVAQATFSANAISVVSSPIGGHQLWVCLDPHIARETVEALRLPSGDVFVCLDAALTDEAKLHLSQLSTLRTI